MPKETNDYDAFPWLSCYENPDELSWFLVGHLECMTTAASAASPCPKFQITFYEIIGPTNRDITKTIWRSGPLHSDQRRRWQEGMKGDFAMQDHGICSPIEEKYKTAKRYLRESAISVSERIPFVVT